MSFAGDGLGTAVLELTTDNRDLERGLRDAQRETERATQGMGKSISNFGESMTKAGKKATVGLTLPIIGAGVAIGKVGMDFEAEMSKITGLVGVASDQVDAWGKDILQLAPQIGRAPQELAEALFFVTSAGFRGAEAMEVLEIAGRGASAGLGETASIADAVTSAVNAYGIENLSAAQSADILTAAVREGKMEASELAPVMGKVLPTASALGIAFEDVAGTMAVMSRTGVNAAEAATSVNAIMSSMLKPTEGAADALGSVGLSMGDLRDMAAQPGGMLEVMRLLESSFEGNDEALASVIPNVRAFRGVMNVLAQDSSIVDDVMNGVANSTGALDDAFEAASLTARFQFDQAMAQIRATLIELSNTLLPFVTQGLRALTQALGWAMDIWRSFSPTIQRFIFIMAGVVAAIGPVLLILGYLTMAFGALLSPIGLVVLAIGGLITLLVTDFLGIRSAITGIFQWLEDRFGSIGDAITTFKQALSGEWVDDDAIMPLHRFIGNIGLAIDGLIDRVRSGFGIIRDSFITFFQAISGEWVDDEDIDPIHRAVGNLGLMVRRLFDTLSGPLGAAWDGITTAAELFLDVVGEIWDKVSLLIDVFNALRTGELDLLQDALDALPGWLEPVGTAMVEIYDAVSKVITAFREDGFIAGLKEIIDVIPDVVGALWDLASAYAGKLWDAVTEVEWLEIGQDILESLSDAIVTAASFVAGVATTVYDWVAGPVSRIEWGELASTIWSGIKTALTATVLTVAAIGAVIYDWIERAVAWVEWGEIASAIWSGISTAFGLFIAGIVIAAETIYDWLSRAVDWVPWSDIASAIWSGITTAFEFAVSTAASVGSTILGWLSAGVDAITDVDWGSVASTIWSGIRTAFVVAAGVVVSVGSVILGWIKSGVDAITDVEWGEIASAVWSGITTGVTVAALGVATLTKRLYDWVSGGVAEVRWGDIGQSLASHLRSAWDLATAGLDAFDTWLRDTLSEVKWDELGQDLKDGLQSAWDFVDSATDEFDIWLRKTIGAPETGPAFSGDLKDNLIAWTGDAWDAVDAATENFDAWLRRTIGSEESGPAFSGDLKENLIAWTESAWDGVDAATEQFDTWLRKSIGAPESGAIFTEEMFHNLLDWIDGVDWERLGERFGKWLSEMVPAAIRGIRGVTKAWERFLIDLVRGGTEDNKKEVGDGFAAALGEGLAYGLVGTGKLIVTVQAAFGAFLRGLVGAIWNSVKEWGEDTVTAWLEGFKDEVGRLDTKSDELRQAVLGWFVDLKDSVLETVDDMIEGVIGFFVDLYNRLVGRSIVPDLVNEIVSLITGMWDDIIGYLDEKRQAMIDVLKAPFEWLRDTFGWDSVTDSATTMWDTIKTHIEDGAESMKEALAAPFRWFRDNIGGIISQAGTYIMWPLKQVIGGLNKLGDAVVGGLSWIGEQLGIGELESLAWKTVGGDFPGSIKDPTGQAMGGGRPDEHGEAKVAGFTIPAATAADPDAMQAIQMGIDGPMDDMGRGGIRDFVSNTIGDVAEWVGSVPGSVIDFVKQGASWIFDQILERFPFDWDLPGVLGGLGVRVVELIRTGLMDAIKDSIRGIEEEIAAQEAAAAQVIDGVYSGGLEGWVRATTGTVTQLFAQNLVPGFYGPAGHTGVDIANAIGTPIRAANSGLVVQSGWNGGYGNAVTIRHNGLSTLYGHMSSLNVSAGQTVTAGQLIGLMGSTGMSTGPHLHLEVRQNGVPINPAGIVPFAGGGIVTEPTIALIGEAGPEAVIPLGMNWDPSKTQIMSGNKVNIGVKPMSGGGLLEAIFGGSGGLSEALFGGSGGLLEAILGGKGGLSEAFSGGKGGLSEAVFGGSGGGLGETISGIVDHYAQVAIMDVLAESGTHPWTSKVGALLTGQLLDQLQRSLEETADFIKFGVAAGWPPAVINALKDEQSDLERELERVMAQTALAFETGLLDPTVARQLGWATVELLDDAVFANVLDLIGQMEDGGASMVGAVIDGLMAGRLDLDHAAAMLPNTVIPHLEQLEQKLVVDLAEAFLMGTDPAGIEGNLEVITALLDALGATAESTAASMAAVSPGGTAGMIQGWSGQPSMGAQGSPSPVDLAFMEMQKANLAAHVAGTSVASQMGTTPIQKLIEQQIDAINTMHMWAFGKPADIQMAEGGVIREPIAGLGLRTGTRYLMGERGDEAVVPLDGNNGRRVVNNNITLQLDRRTVAEAANQQTFEDSRLTVNLLGGA